MAKNDKLLTHKEIAEYDKMFADVTNGVSDKERKEIAKKVRSHRRLQQVREEELEEAKKRAYRYTSVRNCDNLLLMISHKYFPGDVVIVKVKGGLRFYKIASRKGKLKQYKVSTGNWQRHSCRVDEIHEDDIVCLASQYKIVFPNTPGVIV